MTDTDFRKLTNDSRDFPGPRAFVVSGYNSQEITTLSAFLCNIGYGDATIKPCTESQLDHTLETVLNSDTEGLPLGDGSLPNVMVFSGMTSQDVHTVMKRFSRCELTRPIFATTTPTNMNFTVKTLLRHLLEEQKAAMEAIKKQRR